MKCDSCRASLWLLQAKMTDLAAVLMKNHSEVKQLQVSGRKAFDRLGEKRWENAWMNLTLSYALGNGWQRCRLNSAQYVLHLMESNHPSRPLSQCLIRAFFHMISVPVVSREDLAPNKRGVPHLTSNSWAHPIKSKVWINLQGLLSHEMWATLLSQRRVATAKSY